MRLEAKVLRRDRHVLSTAVWDLALRRMRGS